MPEEITQEVFILGIWVMGGILWEAGAETVYSQPPLGTSNSEKAFFTSDHEFPGLN